MTFFELICQQTINGLTLGSVIALIALGYTMVYGIIQLINFAHGDLYMLATFFALTVVAGLPLTVLHNHFGFFLTLAGLLLFTGFFAAAVNFSIEKLVYKPLRRAPRLTLLVSAIGVSFILQNLGLFWGGLPLDVMGHSAAAPKTFPDLIPKINLLPWLGIETAVRFSLKDLVVILLTFPLMAGLYLFVKHSRHGIAMRATAHDPLVASLMGIDTNRIISLTFIIGGFLAGSAGLISGLYLNRVEFTMGYTAGLKAFTAAVLGGIGNIPGAMLGGLLLGIFSVFSDQFLSAQWTNAVVFGILILILIFRPSGLLGKTVKEKV